MSGYNFKAARTDAQFQRMAELEARKICAFCRDKIETETTSPIDFETEHWLVKANDYPYERTKAHLLVVPKEHVATISKLSPAAQAEFMAVISQAEVKYKLDSYAVAIRSGDMRYNGGSVEHIHAHIIAGDPDHPDESPVRFKVSSRPDAN